jgi:hypothetical protein
MATNRRVTAAERIAFQTGTDFAEMKECRYQPTRYATTAVYVLGNDYYCSPTRGKLPNVGYFWEPIGNCYNHTVYRAVATPGNKI